MGKQIVLIASNDDYAKQEIRKRIGQQPYAVAFWECCNGMEAIKYVNALQPDLLIMDILLPGKSGFEILEMAEHAPAVVLMAASSEHAAKAFEYGAVDYWLKPLTATRIERTLNKFEPSRGHMPGSVNSHTQRTVRSNRILVEKGNRLISIPVNKITHLKADKDYTWIHTLNGESYLSTNGIGQLERKLDSRCFIRIHRSYIVNIDYIQELYRDISKLFIALPNNIEISVGRNYLPVIKELIF